MGLGRNGKKSRPAPAMNVTPLVDVVLVLLIIFMVVLPAMEEGVTIDVPSIDNADEVADDGMEPFLLSIAANGTFYFDTSVVAEDGLEAYLRDRHAAQPNRKVVLRADSNVRYASVRSLMHTCRQVGFPGVSLRVNPRNPEGAEQAHN